MILILIFKSHIQLNFLKTTSIFKDLKLFQQMASCIQLIIALIYKQRCYQLIINKIYQLTLMRQRNIPDFNKVSTLVQTDINLINQPIAYDIQRIVGSRLSESGNVSNLIRSQSDAQLLDFFRQQANFFRGLGSFQNVPEQELRKRLLWIEEQIQGLERRKLIVNGLNHADYYAILSDLQGKLDKQFVINSNYEPKLKEAQLKINELEKEIEELRRTVNQQNYYKTQNQLYQEAFKKLSDITKDQRKMREIEKTVNDSIIPLMSEYDVRLDTMIKNMNNMARSSTDPKYRLKGQILGLLRNLDKLIRSSGEMTLENVEKYISEFLKELEISETYQQYEGTKSYKHKFIELERKFNAAVSMFRNKFESLLEQNPNLSNQLDFSVFNLLQRDGVNFYNFDRVITVEISDPRVKTVVNQVFDERTKQYFTLFTSQFKHLMKMFPLIKEHMSSQLLEILSLDIFQDAIDSEDINRIFEVVKYKPDIVKVENIYTYNNQAHLKTIFHLKILIKSLLDELNKVKQKTGVTLQIDQGLLNMIKLEILEYVNPDDVLKVFRTLPKILEVEKIVQRNLSKYQGILTEAHPVVVESVKIAQSVIEKPVILKEQVGIILQKGIPLIAIHEKPIEITVDRIVEVPVEKQVLVEKVIIDQRLIEVDLLKEYPIIKQQIVEVQVPVSQEIIVQVPQIVKQQIPVVTREIIKEVVEVQTYHERLVEVVKEITTLKEVKMIEQVPVEITKFMEVQKIVNNFVPVPQIIQIKEQVPITVTHTVEKPIEVIETIEKIVQVRTFQEKIIEVPVQRQIALIQEVPKPYREVEQVFIKGDKQEIFVEVEKIVQKPIIHQIIKTVSVEKQRIVPVIVRQDRPIIVELKQPYIQNQIEIVTCEIEKIVPYKQQVPIEIVKQIPVAIISEKEVIKPSRVIVEKVIEKIVQVPRVVEVEKIVEKIVVVPRVIENIVLVPQIVEKIVEREVEVLKIIEIQVPVPYYINKEIQQIVQEKIEVPIEKIVYHPVEREKMVMVNTQTQVIKEIQVEVRIPYEVLREKEVPVIRQKIVQKIVTLNNVDVKEREVLLPVRHEVPIEIMHQKAIEVKKIIDNVVQVPQVITKNNILYETVSVPEIHEVIIQRPVEIIKEIVYTNVNNLIEIKPEYRDLIKQVLVKETEKIEILKPEPYYVEKLVVVTNIEQQAVEVKVEKGVPYRVDNIVVLEKPIVVPIVNEVPKVVHVDKVVELRTIHENIKEVPIEGREKTVVLETVKPEVVQITKQVVKVLVEHQEKDVFQQVAVVKQSTQLVNVPTKPIIVHQVKQIFRDNYEPLLLEKVIQRVTVLPQIVEVLKHIHEISEQKIGGIGLGIAEFGIDVQLHTTNYVELCTNLRKGLENLLLTLRNARSSEVKTQVQMIQELIVILGDLIRFPNIVQIPKLVEKVVEVEKPVVIHTKDHQTIMREIAANTLIEKLLVELKRVHRSGVQIKLDNDILNTFFIEMKSVEDLNQRVGQLGYSLVNRFKSLGEWTQENSIMLNNFLEEKFLLSNLVRQSNKSIERLKQKLQISEVSRIKLDEIVTRLNIMNLSLKNSLDEVVDSLNRARRSEVMDTRDVDLILARVNTTISLLNNEENASISQRISRNQHDATTLKKRLFELQKEVQSYRGGQLERSRYVNDQNLELKNEIQANKLEISRLKTLLSQLQLQQNARQRAITSSRVQDLNNLLTEQKLEYDKAVQKLREQFLNREAERSMQTRVITSTIDRSEQQEKQRVIINQLEARIRDLENELANTKNRESRMTVDLERRSVEFEDLRRKLTERQTKITEHDRSTHYAQQERLRFTIVDLESKIRDLKDQLGRSTNDLLKSNDNANKFRSNLEKSQYQQSRLMTELKRKNEEVEGMRTKLSESQIYKSNQKTSSFTQRKPQDIQDHFTSPEVKNSGNSPNTPAAQLGESPEIEQYKFSESSGTDKKQLTNVEYRNLSLVELMREGVAVNENISSKIIIKICERLQSNIQIKLYLFYTPSNIKLLNYSPEDLDKLTVEFGTPIKVREADENEKKYLPPEALRGSQLSEKSCVFNIGIIWDEMLHGETFFKKSIEIEEQEIEYKVRNTRMNPIFKNVLFQILLRDAAKRLDFNEIKRRLSLQRYITTDTKKKS